MYAFRTSRHVDARAECLCAQRVMHLVHHANCMRMRFMGSLLVLQLKSPEWRRRKPKPPDRVNSYCSWSRARRAHAGRSSWSVLGKRGTP